MSEDDVFEEFGFPPRVEQLASIRARLREAVVRREADSEVLRYFAACLFWFGDPSDSIEIWKAKTLHQDAGASLEVQLLCGAGLERTVDYLARREGDVSRAAASWIQRCVDSGDFEGFSPRDYRDFLRRYYRS